MRKKLEKDMSDFRKNAVAMEQALSESKRRKMEEEMADKHRPKYGIGDYDKVIESGSDVVRAALLLKDYNMSKAYGGGVHLLTEEQIGALAYSLQSPNGQEVLKTATSIYEGAVEYGRVLVGLRGQWQRVVEEMAVLLTMWDNADKVAKGMTSTLFSLTDDPSSEMGANLISFLKENFETALAESPYKAYFNFNQETQEFEADIDSGGLYSAILKKQKEAEYQLQTLKSFVEPFSDFLYSEVDFGDTKSLPLWYIPEVVERIMEYPDAVVFDGNPNNKKFFRYVLRRRKKNGETITEKDEKLAVIPDYNETTEILRQRRNAEIKLINLFSSYSPKKENEE